jgi:preprotein translocase subunit SecF
MLKNMNIDFISKRKYAYILSSIIILAGIISLIVKGGPRLGLDFTGGTLVQLNSDANISSDELFTALEKVGFQSPQIQSFVDSSNISFKMNESDHISEEKFNEIKEALGKDFIVEQVEIVGPAVGIWLIKRAILAFVFAFIGIIIYVGIRFNAGFWGLAGVLALLHDVAVVVGIFSIFDIEITLTVVAALMTIVGYSINDTIVIYDRIRENMRIKYKEGIIAIINNSINETMSRTIITSGTTLLMVTSLLIFAGGTLRDFSLALFIGMVTGTYSTIFIAIPIVVDFRGLGKNKPAMKIENNTNKKIDIKAKVKRRMNK